MKNVLQSILFVSVVCAHTSSAQWGGGAVASGSSPVTIAGSASVYDGYDNVFASKSGALVQYYWGPGWVPVTIDSTSWPSPYPGCNTGANSEISAVMNGGDIELYYVSSSGTTLRHAWFDYGAGLWRCDNVDTGSTFTRPSGLTVGGTSNVFYINSSTGRLMHAIWNGTWQKEAIDGPGLFGSGQCNCTVFSLTTESYGSDNQVFYGASGLRYAYRASAGTGGWALTNFGGPTSTVTAATFVGSELHVFSGSRHLWWNGSVWQSQSVIDPVSNAPISVQAFTANEFPPGKWALTVFDGSLANWFHFYQAAGGAAPTKDTRPTFLINRQGTPRMSSYVANGNLSVYVEYHNSTSHVLDQYWR